MSYPLEWAKDLGAILKLPRNERAVLDHLGWRAGREWEAWPDYADIVLCTGYGETKIREAVRALKGRGLIIWEERRCAGRADCGRRDGMCRGGHKKKGRYYLREADGEALIAEAIMRGQRLPSGRHKSQKAYQEAAAKVAREDETAGSVSEHQAQNVAGQLQPAVSEGRSASPVEIQPAVSEGWRETPGQLQPSVSEGWWDQPSVSEHQPSVSEGLPLHKERARVSNSNQNVNLSSSSPESGEARAEAVPQLAERGEEERGEVPSQMPVGSLAFGRDRHRPSTASSDGPAGESEAGRGSTAVDADAGAATVAATVAGLAGQVSGQVAGGVAEAGRASVHQQVDLARFGREVATHTGISADAASLAALVDTILGRASSPVQNPQAFVAAAVRTNPQRTQQDLAAGKAASAGSLAGAVSAQVAGQAGGGMAAGLAGQSATGVAGGDRPGCPVDDHASFGHRKGRCPMCRSNAISEGWKTEYDRGQMTRAKFEKLSAEEQQAVDKQGIEISG